MKHLKIMQVSRMYYPVHGGIERVVQDIAEGLKDNTDMTVLTCQNRGHGTVEEIHGVTVHRCSSLGTVCSLPLSFSFLSEFKRLSKEQDIIHIHMPFPLADLACLLSGYKGKVVVWWHSDVVRQKKLMFFYRPIMERFLKRVDAIVVATEGHISGSSYLGDYKDKCHVIPFGVDKTVLQRADEYLAHRGELNKELIFLFVGRLVYYKGCSVLLEAFSKLQGGILHIVGDGPLKHELEQQADMLGIHSRVYFTGSLPHEELYREFAECDVFVLPSVAKSEAFGIVQIEAMAYNKPVINTNLPSGVPYVSLDKITGLTVEPRDAEGLAGAMRWMMDHPEERIRLGSNAGKRAREYYSIDYMLEQVDALYQMIGQEG